VDWRANVFSKFNLYVNGDGDEKATAEVIITSSLATDISSRVQTPGYIPTGFFWVNPRKKNPPKNPPQKYVCFTCCFANNKTLYSIYCG